MFITIKSLKEQISKKKFITCIIMNEKDIFFTIICTTNVVQIIVKKIPSFLSDVMEKMCLNKNCSQYFFKLRLRTFLKCSSFFMNLILNVLKLEVLEKKSVYEAVRPSVFRSSIC